MCVYHVRRIQTTTHTCAPCLVCMHFMHSSTDADSDDSCQPFMASMDSRPAERCYGGKPKGLQLEAIEDNNVSSVASHE